MNNNNQQANDDLLLLEGDYNHAIREFRDALNNALTIQMIVNLLKIDSNIIKFTNDELNQKFVELRSIYNDLHNA